MATTLPAILALVNADTSSTTDVIPYVGRRGIASVDNAPPPVALTAAQRATMVTAVLGGTVATFADVVTLVATATSGAVTTPHVWRLILGYGNDMTVG